MDNIFTTEPTAEEAAQFQTLLNETAAEMKRIRENIDRDQREIEASQARTDVILSDIRKILDNRWRG